MLTQRPMDYTAPPFITAINVNISNAHQWVGEYTIGRVYPSIQQIITQNQSNKLLTNNLGESQKT